MWAIVLLLFIVYAVGVLLRQTVGMENIAVGDKYGTVLFDSVLGSMFLVFRLCMSDADLPDGTPLIGHMQGRYGIAWTIPYTLFLLFIVFGIFNLITAVFVENVMESAKQKKQLTLVQERVRIAEKLRELILIFTGHNNGEGRKRWWQILLDLNPVSVEHAVDVEEATAHALEEHTSFEIDSQITREMFMKAIRDPQVDELLDDLEVHMADRTELFDVLDADGSGAIDISELIAGLMKMRSGGADKSDTVATYLKMIAMQGQIMALDTSVANLEDRLRQTR